MKIVYLVHCFPPAVGGLEFLSGEIVSLLRLSGHQVDVITGQGRTLDSYKTFSDWVDMGSDPANIHRLPLQTSLQRWANRLLNKAIFISGSFSPWYFGPILNYNPATIDLIKSADLILGAGMPTYSFYESYRLAKKYQKRLILLPAFHDVSYYQRSWPFVQALNFASAIICLTPKEKHDLLVAYKIAPSKIQVMTYCPYSAEDWRKAAQLASLRHQRLLKKLKNHQHITLGFVGQITLRKNLAWFANFFQNHSHQLKSQGINIRLFLAGAKTNSSDQIEQLLAPYQKQVKIIYNFPKKDKQKIYNQIDIFINPSLEESLGLVNFDALIQGLPLFIDPNSAFASLPLPSTPKLTKLSPALQPLISLLSQHLLPISPPTNTTQPSFSHLTQLHFHSQLTKLLDVG